MRTMIAVGLAAMIAGCHSADPAIKRSQNTVTLLVDSRQSLIAAEGRVGEAQVALANLQKASGDLRAPFELMKTTAGDVADESRRIAAQSEQFKQQAADYNDARQADVASIGNADMRTAAEGRAAEVRARCNSINSLYDDVNKAFSVYLRNIGDLEKYLANELNYPALQSASQWLSEAQASGVELRQKIRALNDELGTTSNILSPVPVASRQNPDVLPTGTAPAAANNALALAPR